MGVLQLHPCRVVKEEISDDNAKLPCFNGRVVSWVSPQVSMGRWQRAPVLGRGAPELQGWGWAWVSLVWGWVGEGWSPVPKGEL